MNHLLHTMFVDKKLSGVKAVQTLSRLKRITSGKEDTFVLDFVNTAEEMKESFEPFYQATILSEEASPNIIYDIKNTLEDFMADERMVDLAKNNSQSTFEKIFVPEFKDIAAQRYE